ncbi:hypothetical protein BDQ12DRAFT_722476 [Crucibulum laeve]|uniref:F-box domain-containing protein n=1 Tax=Crucibulum laeve TaxID=68775 RepID=A0A5C3M2K5_9AGAR|nr:hypothetical protein BDQ12DRAFT_722476 [Crucibulum laeve]
MVTLLSLAPELLHEIGYKLDGSQNRELRTVCRQLNNALEAMALSTLVINLNRNTAKASIDQLQAYATKSTRVGTYVHHLEIRCLAPAHDPKSRETQNRFFWPYIPPPTSEDIVVERQLRGYLSLALASLTNTQSVTWCTSFQDPKWVNDTVQDFLKTLTGFKHFTLNFHGGFSGDLSLDCVYDLKKLTVSGYRDSHAVKDQIAGIIAASPALDHLDIDIGTFPQDEYSPSLQKFLLRIHAEIILPITHLNGRCLRVFFDDKIIRHFRSLKSFNVCYHEYDSLIGSTWHCFQTEHIHLEEIHVNITHISSSLIDYLTSNYKQFASDFYAQVLPKHCESLESLELRPAAPGSWCFSDSLSPAFKSCQRLKELAVTLDFCPVSNIEGTNGLNVVKRTASALPLLERLIVYAVDGTYREPKLIFDSSIPTP